MSYQEGIRVRIRLFRAGRSEFQQVPSRTLQHPYLSVGTACFQSNPDPFPAGPPCLGGPVGLFPTLEPVACPPKPAAFMFRSLGGADRIRGTMYTASEKPIHTTGSLESVATDPPQPPKGKARKRHGSRTSAEVLPDMTAGPMPRTLPGSAVWEAASCPPRGRPGLPRRIPGSAIWASGLLLIAVGLGLASHRQCHVWHDARTL